VSQTAHDSAVDAAVLSWLRLALATGPVLGRRLLDAFGSPAAVFSASAAELQRVEGLGPTRLARLRDADVEAAARRECERARAVDVKLVPLDDPGYPPHLRRLESPPLVVWRRGGLIPADRMAIAVVGPRQPSVYARQMVDRIVRPLAAQGITIVSGMAYGIDAEAHRAALEVGGRTLAVLGQGLATPIYPRAHAPLAAEILDRRRGALLSVLPCDTEPSPGHFPLRNEIIAGVSLGVLVIEAGAASGTLITARHAAAANRPVMACPADATRRAAEGSNRLIRDGAVLVRSADDVLETLANDLRHEMEELGVRAGQAAPAPEPEAGGAEGPPPAEAAAAGPLPRPKDPLARLILAQLNEEPLPTDALLERCARQGHGTPAVLERLLQLEIDGWLRQLPGRLYTLKGR